MEGELLQNSVEPLVNEDNVDSEEELQQSLNLFKQFLGYAFCNVDSRITRLPPSPPKKKYASLDKSVEKKSHESSAFVSCFNKTWRSLY